MLLFLQTWRFRTAGGVWTWPLRTCFLGLPFVWGRLQMGLTLRNDHHEDGGIKKFPFYMAELSRASILWAQAQF